QSVMAQEGRDPVRGSLRLLYEAPDDGEHQLAGGGFVHPTELHQQPVALGLSQKIAITDRHLGPAQHVAQQGLETVPNLRNIREQKAGRAEVEPSQEFTGAPHQRKTQLEAVGPGAPRLQVKNCPLARQIRRSLGVLENEGEKSEAALLVWKKGPVEGLLPL